MAKGNYVQRNINITPELVEMVDEYGAAHGTDNFSASIRLVLMEWYNLRRAGLFAPITPATDPIKIHVTKS